MDVKDIVNVNYKMFKECPYEILNQFELKEYPKEYIICHQDQVYDFLRHRRGPCQHIQDFNRGVKVTRPSIEKVTISASWRYLAGNLTFALWRP